MPMVDIHFVIKHMYLLYWYFQCLNIQKQICRTHRLACMGPYAHGAPGQPTHVPMREDGTDINNCVLTALAVSFPSRNNSSSSAAHVRINMIFKHRYIMV